MTNEERIDILNEKKNLINAVSPSFCSAKWLQTTLYLQNGYNHSCHHPSPHKIPVEEVIADPSALHNSRLKKEARMQMRAGIRPAECDYCWRIEDLNSSYFSDRHYKTADYWAWDRFTEIAELDPQKNVYPSYLEISFSNVCNFACAYCSPEISSKWMEDITHNGPYPVTHGKHDLEWMKSVGKYPYLHSEPNPYVDAFWKWFPEALPHLRVLRVTGGEPTLSKDVWKLFDYLAENPQPHLEFAINTNMNTNNIDRLLDAALSIKNKVKLVDIYTSLESIGDQAEYARDGLNYNLWLDNVENFLSRSDFKVSIMTTINILSVLGFDKFLLLILELRKKYNTCFEVNRIPFTVNYLRWPLHLQCDLLDVEYRSKIADNILEISNNWTKYNSPDKFARIYLEELDQLKRFSAYLKTQPNNMKYRKDFLNFISEYDKRRNKKFQATFPQYSFLVNEWK